MVRISLSMLLSMNRKLCRTFPYFDVCACTAAKGVSAGSGASILLAKVAKEGGRRKLVFCA